MKREGLDSIGGNLTEEGNLKEQITLQVFALSSKKHLLLLINSVNFLDQSFLLSQEKVMVLTN